MGLQTFKMTPSLPYAVPCHPLRTSCAGYGMESLYEERTWRCPAQDDRNATIDADILVSRWIDLRNCSRREKTVSSPDRHVIGVALKTTSLKLMRGPHTIFDRLMPAGTLHVTGPSQPLTAEYRREREDAARSGLSQPIRDLNDFVIRDPLAELLGRTLVEGGRAGDRLYAESVGQTLVMHIARLELPRPTVNALPKWRLKRVQEYVDAHLDESISLADLAQVAGLSRMHFAAQFRAATGYRPHDYLLYQRIESAKAMLSSTDMPLAEIALNAGFQAQAHFSTVFKRLTGETPARWRFSVIRDRNSPEMLGRPAAVNRNHTAAAL